MVFPPEVMDLIIDKCDRKTLKKFSVTCKGLSFRSQHRILERIVFSGHSNSPFSLSDWPKEKPKFQKRAKHAKTIFYVEGSKPRSRTDHAELLSIFVGVETLQLEMADLRVEFAPRFTALKAVRFLSLRLCSMNIQVFRRYLLSFPLLEFLSILLPCFNPDDLSSPPIAQDSKRDARQVALHLGTIVLPHCLPLLNVLSSVPFDFTGIRLDSCSRVPFPMFSSFLESKKGAMTVIGVNGESLLPIPLSFSRNPSLRRRSDFGWTSEPGYRREGGTL